MNHFSFMSSGMNPMRMRSIWLAENDRLRARVVRCFGSGLVAQSVGRAGLVDTACNLLDRVQSRMPPGPPWAGVR